MSTLEERDNVEERARARAILCGGKRGSPFLNPPRGGRGVLGGRFLSSPKRKPPPPFSKKIKTLPNHFSPTHEVGSPPRKNGRPGVLPPRTLNGCFPQNRYNSGKPGTFAENLVPPFAPN